MGDAKTKSAPKGHKKAAPKRHKGWALYRRVLIIILVLAVVVLLTTPRGRFISLTTSHKTYRLLVAQSASQQATGLGNRASLPHDEGMLFPTTAMSSKCFWMKDMQFPLDIIWVGSDKKVTSIQAGLSPSTYPHAYCADAQDVIELNAGQAKAAGIHVGSTLGY